MYLASFRIPWVRKKIFGKIYLHTFNKKAYKLKKLEHNRK